MTIQAVYNSWAAWHITRLLIKLTPKGVVFSFLSVYNRSEDDGCAELIECSRETARTGCQSAHKLAQIAAFSFTS